MSETHKKTVLFLSAQPEGTEPLRLQKEFGAINTEWQKATNKVRFDLRQLGQVESGDFDQQVHQHKPFVVHFAGHGDEYGVVISDPRNRTNHLTGEQLGPFFKNYGSQVECVVLNACFSTKTASAIAQYIPFVVGISDKILDSDALHFSEVFYRHLFEGKDIGIAFEKAKGSLNMKALGKEQLLVLYTKPKPEPSRPIAANLIPWKYFWDCDRVQIQEAFMMRFEQKRPTDGFVLLGTEEDQLDHFWLRIREELQKSMSTSPLCDPAEFDRHRLQEEQGQKFNWGGWLSHWPTDDAEDLFELLNPVSHWRRKLIVDRLGIGGEPISSLSEAAEHFATGKNDRFTQVVALLPLRIHHIKQEHALKVFQALGDLLRELFTANNSMGSRRMLLLVSVEVEQAEDLARILHIAQEQLLQGSLLPVVGQIEKRHIEDWLRKLIPDKDNRTNHLREILEALPAGVERWPMYRVEKKLHEILHRNR